MKKDKPNNRFYVYALLDPRKPGKYVYEKYEFEYEPFYVGKGEGKRMYKHTTVKAELDKKTHKANKIKKLLSENKKPEIIVIQKGLMENAAYKIEIKCIATIGRLNIKTGPLTNVTEGGGGSAVDVIFTEERREKMSKSKLGKKNPMYGKKYSEEDKIKRGLRRKGKDNPLYGTTLSEKTKKKISKSRKGIKPSKETLAKLSVARKGRVMSEGAKKKLSIAKTGKKLSKKHIQAVKRGWDRRKKIYPNGYSEEQRKNMCKINKGKINIKIYKMTSPTGEIFYTNNGLTLFCEEHNLSQSGMSQLVSGKIKNNRSGWKCEFVSKPKYDDVKPL